MKKTVLAITKTVAIIFFWLTLWQLGALWLGKELLLPTPVSAFIALSKMIVTPQFRLSVGMTLLRILLGIIIATVLGILLAVATHRSKLLYSLLYPIITILRSTPVASFVVLAVLWLGANNLPVLICAVIVFPIMWEAVSSGIKAADPKLIEVARVLGFSFFKKVRYIYIPSVFPRFMSSCKNSVGMAWKAGVSAEVIALSPLSIGRGLYTSKMNLETPELFAWTATVVILSLLIEILITRLVTRASKKYVRFEV